MAASPFAPIGRTGDPSAYLQFDPADPGPDLHGPDLSPGLDIPDIGPRESVDRPDVILDRASVVARQNGRRR